MKTAVSFQNVTKNYKDHQALKGITLDIPKGEVVTLLGPNGAGKSTSIGMILGLVDPSSGSVLVLGGSPHDQQTKSRLGCTPQNSDFPENLKSIEVLEMVRAHYTKPRDIGEISKRFFVEKFLNRNANELSGGQKRCLSLACAFIGNPELIVLDEPTVGLDVDVRKSLWNEIRGYVKGGGSVLMTTHYLEEAESVSDEIVVIDRGQIIRRGTPEEIKKSFSRYKIRFRSKSELSFPDEVSCVRDRDQYTLVTSNSDRLIKDIIIKNDFSDLEVSPMSLEEAFLEIIKK